MAIIPKNTSGKSGTYVEKNAGGPGIMGVEDAVKGYSIRGGQWNCFPRRNIPPEFPNFGNNVKMESAI